MSRWVETLLSSGDEVPDSPGVYVIQADGISIYIGQSRSLRKRIKQHDREADEEHRMWGGWDDDVAVFKFGEFRCTFIPTVKYRVEEKLGRSLMSEYRLIDRIQPSGNQRGVHHDN